MRKAWLLAFAAVLVAACSSEETGGSPAAGSTASGTGTGTGGAGATGSGGGTGASSTAASSSTGGGPGSGGSASGGAGGVGGAGGSGDPCASVPPPVGVLNCGTGSGGNMCTIDCTDDNGDVHGSKCTGPDCSCFYNGQLACTCTVRGGDAICVAETNTFASCCP